jgi:hypothetical protein
MTWRRYDIPETDKRAKEHILLSLSVGAHDHTLTKKLLSKFSAAEGPIFAIGLDGVDIKDLHCFDCGPKYFGKFWDGLTLKIGDRPNDGLLSFLFDFLRQPHQGLIVMEDWVSKRNDECMTPEHRAAYDFKSRLAFFNDEVFHVIAAGDTDLDVAEDAVRSAERRYLNGACVRGVGLPETTSWTAEFLDTLVTATTHIFVGAFDMEGYLVWSPNSC